MEKRVQKNKEIPLSDETHLKICSKRKNLSKAIITF